MVAQTFLLHMESDLTLLLTQMSAAEGGEIEVYANARLRSIVSESNFLFAAQSQVLQVECHI